MMHIYRFLIVTLAVIAISRNAHAQPPHGYLISELKHDSCVAPNTMVITKGRSGMAARTTAGAQSRCVGIVTYRNWGSYYAPIDSVVYNYPGARENFQFDEGFRYRYVTPSRTYADSIRYTQAFDGSNNLTNELSQVKNWATGDWVNNEQTTSTYDGINNKLTAISQKWNTATGAWVNNEQYTYTYTGSNVTTEVKETWVSGSWRKDYRLTSAYVSGDLLATQVVEVWNTSTLSWEYNNRRTHTYDITRDKIAWLMEEWTGTDWKSLQQEMYTNDGAHHLLTRMSQYWDGTVWVNTTSALFSDYVGDVYQVLIYQYWDGTTYANQVRYTFTYNSYSQPTYMYDDRWDVSAGAWSAGNGATRYYYQLYGSGLTNVANEGAQMSIYPVPTTNAVTMEIMWRNPEPFVVSVSDMQGRVVSSYTEGATAQYKKVISLAALPAGIYTVQVTSASGRQVKQLVVR